MDMTCEYDVVIAGARPAGTATALLLARAGVRVLVVERDTPGTDTLSTHALMRGGVMQLTRWGVADGLWAAGTPRVRQTRFVYGTEEVVVDISDQHGVDALMAPRRTVLDPALAAAAAAAGAELRYGTFFDGVEHDADGRVTAAVLRDDAGIRKIRGEMVVGADGRRSRVARAVGAPVTLAGRQAAATIYAYFEGITDIGYRWHFGDRLGAGAVPTNDGRHVIFVGLPPARFRGLSGSDRSAALRALLAEVHPGLAAEVAAGRQVAPPLAFAGEPGYLRRPWGPGWALVGDAGYFKDPITAHGITDALRDAELLANAILAGTEAALKDYEATRDRLSLPLFAVTDALAALDWTLAEAQSLHGELHRAMKAEQDCMAGGGMVARAA